MKDTLKQSISQLAESCGPSGSEEKVREQLRNMVAPYADEVREDVIGNLLVTKRGIGVDRKHLLLVAHMDEPGLIVIHIDGDGYLRVAPVGPGEAAYLVGQRVKFPSGIVGVVGAHDVSDPGDVTFASLYIDLGVDSKEMAEELVQIGESCVIVQPTIELAPDRLVGKALDNRVGCSVAAEVLKRLNGCPHDVTVVFTVQQHVGQRGVKPAAFGLSPDFALVLDGVRSGDTPGADRIEIGLGKGVSVKIIDKTVIIPPRIKNYLVDLAEANGIPYQLEVCPDGTSDAGSLLISRDGIPTGGLSIPVRYLVSGSEMVDLRDAEAAASLALQALQNYR
ncbi:hypothetical protein OS242_02745 [Tumebacillus sp. DT12]|uniref:Aminopeptidase n=1 Tax=Tumebacillus lacus TaxID=2995335 RepID=A0ABT3WW19_9BACL|nr:hypothetical protein [Tumebacillus lacus]MCX7568878.1 hypothetical protein [Tumebacillus lacus]